MSLDPTDYKDLSGRLAAEVERWVEWARSSRCIYCGTVLPNPLDEQQDEADRIKREHIAACERHPLRAEKARADKAEAEVVRLTRERDEARTALAPHWNARVEAQARVAALTDALREIGTMAGGPGCLCGRIYERVRAALAAGEKP